MIFQNSACLRRHLAECFLITLVLGWPCICAAGIRLTGADGHTLIFKAPAARIVSLAPDLTELAFDVGAGAQVVGTSRFSNYPAAARKVPRVGDAFNFDTERILVLKPDLVLAWGGGTPTLLIRRLRSLGLPVLVMGSSRLADIAHNLKLIGQASGHAVQAQAVADKFLAGLARLRRHDGERALVRVFYEISAVPLYTVGGRQIISHMIALCGGRNIYSDLKRLAAPVSLGSVLARNPQAVITGGDDQAAARLKAWHRWPMISAVRTHSLFSISDDLLARATPRILQGGEQLCEDLEKVRGRHAQTSDETLTR